MRMTLLLLAPLVIFQIQTTAGLNGIPLMRMPVFLQRLQIHELMEMERKMVVTEKEKEGCPAKAAVLLRRRILLAIY